MEGWAGTMHGLDALRRYGSDAVSFQSLEPGLCWWRDDAPPEGTGAALAYLPVGRSWIAVGTPLVSDEVRAEAVRRFVTAARSARRRAVFFGVEDTAAFVGCRRLTLGLQPVLKPSEWSATLRRSLRHPNGPPWAVAVPLVMWTVLLAVLGSAGDAGGLGFSASTLWAWIVFDAVLAWLLFKAAGKPRRRGLGLTAAAAAFDAVVSVKHLAAVGLGRTLSGTVLRLAATAGPIFGTTALLWACWRAHLAHTARGAAKRRATG